MTIKSSFWLPLLLLAAFAAAHASPAGSATSAITGVTAGLRRSDEPFKTNEELWDAAKDWCAGGSERTAVVATFGPIDTWDVSEITDMSGLFKDQRTCNPPIGNWDVGKVTSMERMFAGASAFDHPLNNWNVSQVKDMDWIAHAALPQWRDSTDGIHAFLTFDSAMEHQKANITAFASRIDYVWGASAANVATWRASPNPAVVLSKYIPFTRDPAPHVTPVPNTSGSGLPWWQTHKPELVLYRCDRKTPAWECFAGEGCAHVSVPLDLTNPATLDYQMEVGVLPAAQIGYSAIALDNFGLRNQWEACGAFRGTNGTWVQLYNESDPTKDPKYTADVIDWLGRAVARIHAAGMLVIPNFSEMDDDAATLRVTNLTDGILAEGGFTDWNPVPNTSSATSPPLKTSPAKFERQVGFVRNLQRHGKGFFAINEWGAGPDYHLNPSKIPYNISGPQHRAIRQFVVAAFMMVNGGACGIYLTCIQCYGGGAGGEGGLSLWPEYSAQVGHPLGEPVKEKDSGVWSRLYSAGIAMVNPGAVGQVYPLPAPRNKWYDLYGEAVPAQQIHLPAASGLVLLDISK